MIKPGDIVKIIHSYAWDKSKIGTVCKVLSVYEVGWDKLSPYKADIEFEDGKVIYKFDVSNLEQINVNNEES